MDSPEIVPPVQPPSILDELKKVLPARGRVWVFPHDYPDPDALAAAAGMALLLAKQFHLRPEIIFSGAVTRPENKELLQHYGMKWRYLKDVPTPSKAIPAIVVDVTPATGHVTLPPFAKVMAVIDHHVPPVLKKNTREMAIPFRDVRPDMGACATIVLEYLRLANIMLPRWLCTVMVYAIQTETQDLTRGQTPADIKAYFSMLERANLSTLAEIRMPQLPRAYFSRLQEAISHAYTYGHVVWSHLKKVDDSSTVAEIADLLLRLERVTWGVCTAFRNDRLLFSLRSSRPGANCAFLAQRLARRHGAGGGHPQMAAGYIDVVGLTDEERETRRLQLLQQVIQHTFKGKRDLDLTLEKVARPLVETASAILDKATAVTMLPISQ